MIFSAFERMVAWRYLRARKAEGFVSLITAISLGGIALGVAALIVITSVMNGVKSEMIRHFIGMSGHVTVYGAQGGIEDYEALARELGRIPGVVRVTPVIEGEVMASHQGKAYGAQAMGMRYEDFIQREAMKEKIEQGDLATFRSGEGLVMGKRLAENLGLGIHDPVTLISPDGRRTIAGTVPRLQSWPLAATFSLGMHMYDAGLIILPFREAQIFFKLADNGRDLASALLVTVADAEQARVIGTEIARRLGNGYRVYDWRTSNHSVVEALDIQRNVMFVILMLIVLVAAFNIVSSLIMLVQEKGRDIAILRTMGATQGMVLRIFILCGSLVGLTGTMIGVLLGLALAVNADRIRQWVEHVTGGRILAEQLYFLASLPAEIDPREVAGVAALSLLLSFLATLYPARRAARLDPAEGVRYG
jgi:lipoprotein-releasing system permease protein